MVREPKWVTSDVIRLAPELNMNRRWRGADSLATRAVAETATPSDKGALERWR